MTASDYQDYVFSRATDPFSDKQYVHAALGATSESGELAGIIRKAYTKHTEVDPLKVFDECGDTLYYLAMALNRTGHTLTECMAHNVEKLTHRAAYGKDKIAERKILERYAR